MANFEIIFELQPPHLFGLPEQGATVLPAPMECSAPTIDTWSLVPIGHGTLSIYRTKAFEATIARCNGPILRILDNFLTVVLAASDDLEAIRKAEIEASRFCRALAFRLARYVEPHYRGGSNADLRTPIKAPVFLYKYRAHGYDLKSLTSTVEQLSLDLSATDEKLERATAYFYHAVFLQKHLEVSDPRSFHHYYTLGEIILHFHKAMSVLVGDPSCGDPHQSQYKSFGLERSVWERSEQVRKARNDMDVAHYKADPSDVDTLARTSREACAVAVQVIDAYLRWHQSE